MTSVGTTLDRQAERLLEFWFGALDNGFADAAHRGRWFAGGDDFDAECAAKFGELAEQVYGNSLDHWFDQPRGMLAYILLCDQLPRNLHRGSERAFRADPLALKAAQHGVLNGLDRGLGCDERAFFYLPFEHSENLLNQHTAVGLYSLLRDETPVEYRHLTGNYLRHAHQHRDTIIRFGRFPYRNAALGRVSSAAELDYLQSQQ